jgi:transposase
MKKVTLTMKEKQRVSIVCELLKKRKNKSGDRLTVVQAAPCLGLSERQVFRLKARYRKQGSPGLAHGNRGRASDRKMSEEKEDRIVKLAQGKYQGFNDTHLTEKLNEVEGIPVSRPKVQRLLRQRGMASVKKKRRSLHRTRRERKPQEGLMLQTDGSPHDWLEGRGPRMSLLGLIDDATSDVPTGFFDEEETSWGYFKLFYEAFSQKGLPYSIYADRHSIFYTDREPTLEEQLEGRKPETQVARALRELGITLIPAYSPQAKGRIERLWGTFQDRLVSELRLEKAQTKQQANAFLKQWLPSYNRRFTKPAAHPKSAWRPIPKGVNLEQILCFKEQRVVANDNTVSWHRRVLQIPPSPHRPSFAKAKVEVRELLNREIQIYDQNHCIAKFPPEVTSLNALRQEISKEEGLRYSPNSKQKKAA